ncbi:hypothetical protein [Helicobacter sp. 11S03491-1]|uniref:hypothetical protein n=1 Tax=Helicobacter sp. 11S03491-1 TaxID=1476196 RepID=UPI000BA72DA0|nr:hypothetical protein [Helicobacter sp. 11S03491-1]PAF41434.1 hypothetical protein BKH45_06850 [Helicobacter sp. 11S03491-1]
MTKNVNFELKFNTKVGQLQKANEVLEETEKKANAASKGFNTLKDRIDGVAHSLQASSIGLSGLKVAYNFLASPIKEAIHLNSVLEQQKLSLASLVTLNHQNTDSLGRSISATDKWSLSMQKANEIIEDMKRIHQSSIYAVADLTEMFKSFYSTAASSMSLTQAQKVFEGIVYAAQTSGASVDSLKATLDSLGSGVAQTVTTFGRFVAAQGLSTEAMSKAKKEVGGFMLFTEFVINEKRKTCH